MNLRIVKEKSLFFIEEERRFLWWKWWKKMGDTDYDDLGEYFIPYAFTELEKAEEKLKKLNIC